MDLAHQTRRIDQPSRRRQPPWAGAGAPRRPPSSGALRRAGRRRSAMNRVLLTGRLTRDPEMRVVSNGKNVTHVSLEIYRPSEPRASHGVNDQDGEQSPTGSDSSPRFRRQTSNSPSFSPPRQSIPPL